MVHYAQYLVYVLLTRYNESSRQWLIFTLLFLHVWYPTFFGSGKCLAKESKACTPKDVGEYAQAAIHNRASTLL